MPDRVRVPAPAFVKLLLPLMAPPTVNVLAVVVTVGLAVKVTAPVPKSRLFDPVKVKLPFQVCGLLLVRAIAPPLVLSMVVPAAMANVPAVDPKAVVLLISKVPLLKVIPPE